MTVRKLSQKSFVNGQYDRAAQNQESYTNASIVSSGLAYAKNVLSSDKGELRKRLGTKYIKELSGATVIVPYRKPDDDDLVLLFSPNQLDVLEYKNDKCDYYEPETNTKISQVWTDNTTGGYTLSVDGVIGSRNDEAYTALNDPVYDVGTGRLSGWLYNSYSGSSGMKVLLNRFAVQIELPQEENLGEVVVNFAIGFKVVSNPEPTQGYMGYTNAILQYSDDGSNWVSVYSEMSSVVGNTPYYHYRGLIYDGTVTHREYCIDYTIINNDNNCGKHLYWRILFIDPLSSQGGTMEQRPVLHLQFYTRQQGVYAPIQTDISNLKAIKYSQSNRLLKITDGEKTPKNITLSGSITCSDWTPTNTPNLWVDYGKPKTVLYSMGRLWFAGFDNHPDTVIASKFNAENTFTPNSPAQYDDALELVSNQLKSIITNIAGGQRVVYCFSQDGISMIDGGSTGLIATNQNIEFNLRNRMPAGDATPAFKDDVMLYSSSDGTKLYGVDYDLLVERFQVSDLAKYAKDVTKAKITELHYLNNEAKLVYGLTEENTMFALLYEKGQYQGFFPLDFGGQVYDICPIKVGRDYKLLMVVFRDDHWYLEEKLDLGNYIDTSKIRMTAEEKKWATYDNLENNIALDCYQTYDESFSAHVVINDSVAETTDDLSAYIGKSVMFGQMNDSKSWCLATIEDQNQNTYWVLGEVLPDVTQPLIIAIKENGRTQPEVGDEVFEVTDYFQFEIQPTGKLVTSVEWGATNQDKKVQITDINAFYALTSRNAKGWLYNLTIAETRGTADAYDTIYPEFSTFQPNLPQTADVAVISEGRYFDAQHPDNSGNLQLPLPCHRLIYGVVYEALAVIKLQTPYESMKEVVQVDVSLIDTTHLEIGTDLSDTLTIETINDSSYYDLTAITINDTCRVVVGDTPEMTKKVMFRSNKGVPFTINAVEVYVNYSNLGGN